MDINDLINFSNESKPVEMRDAFNELMADKVAAKIDAFRPEVTAAMFGTGAEE